MDAMGMRGFGFVQPSHIFDPSEVHAIFKPALALDSLDGLGWNPHIFLRQATWRIIPGRT